MKKILLATSVLIVGIVTFTGFVVGQESTYLAQKLMLENDLRKRITSALDKILEDHRYVLDVSVELKFTPTVREEITYKPSEPTGLVTKKSVGEEEEPSVVPEETRRRRSRMTGIPIPGFDFQVEEEPAETAEPEKKEGAEEEAKAPKKAPQVISQKYTDISTSMPVIEKIEISCILPEGSPPELIENVRQIIMVASHFDRSRGDVLSIMTASFKERRDQRTAEAIILRSIAEKIDQLEKKQKEAVKGAEEIDWREELLRWREEEAKRREEERAVWKAEIEKLQNERLRREFEREKQAILERDSLRLASLTEEINQLKELLASAQLSTEETQVTQEVVAAKEREKARLDSLMEVKWSMLRDTEEEMKRLEGGMSNLPIYLMSAISLLAVIALAAVIIFNGRTKPRYVVPPPWMMPRPPAKKKVKKKVKKEEPEEAPPPKAAPPPTPTPTIAPLPPTEDPGVIQSEIKSVRQSIVSMSVGQPETATSIIKEWLEEEAPPAPAVEAPAPSTEEAAPSEEVEEAKGKQKKKKKK